MNAVLPFTQQQEVPQRFAEEVIPLVRREVSTTLWGPGGSGRAKGFTAHPDARFDALRDSTPRIAPSGSA